jgi:hypothetical protein
MKIWAGLGLPFKKKKHETCAVIKPGHTSRGRVSQQSKIEENVSSNSCNRMYL